MTDSLAFKFSIPFAESLAFAELSGDHNPLHVDPLTARRTQFGGTVVHGIHLLLKAADRLADLWTQSGLEPESVSIDFNYPVSSEAQVTVRATFAEDAPGVMVVGESNGRLAFTLILTTGSPHRDASQQDLSVRWRPPLGRPKELAFPPPLYLAGEVPVGLDLDGLARILPNLAATGHLGWVADLLASTRIVGMECPGLHSIFSGLKLTRLRAENLGRTSSMRFCIDRIDPRFRFARIAVSGSHFEGALETFFRPAAVAQRLLSEVANLVPSGLFYGQRALVIGGSRGLGEIAAKILLAGGAEVTITYARGQADAERIQAEAQTLGWHCSAWPLDAGSLLDDAPPDWLTGGDFSHAYFFASPQIERNASGRWSHEIFARLTNVYVRGFAALAEALTRGAKKPVSPLRLLYPSSVFLDVDEPGFAEYCAAKAAGEALARHLARALGAIIVAPRLPRMRTDQTSALIKVGAGDPFPVVLKLLRGFHA